MKLSFQERASRGLLALGATEHRMPSRKRAFDHNGAHYYVSARAIRVGRTVALSRPISDAALVYIMAANESANSPRVLGRLLVEENW